MMIIVTAMMEVKSGKKEAFITEAQSLISATKNERLYQL